MFWVSDTDSDTDTNQNTEIIIIPIWEEIESILSWRKW